MSFDPYHQWLGIPPTEQPPNHYRLLGIADFESDPDVICNAADRQMAHARTFQLGKHAGDSQRLLSEIAAARACLLNAETRADYDRALRQTDPSPPAPTIPAVAVAPPRRRRTNRWQRQVAAALSALVVVVLGWAAAVSLRPSRQNVPHSASHSTSGSTAAATSQLKAGAGKLSRLVTPDAKPEFGLEFDGNAWVQTELKYDGRSPLTIELWATPAAHHQQSIVANNHGRGLSLGISKDGHWGFWVRDQRTYRGAVSNEKARVGERAHIAGVLDGRLVQLFVNGQLQNTTDSLQSRHKESKRRFMLGADPDFHGQPQTHFQGTIDAVHVSQSVVYENQFSPPARLAPGPSSVLLLSLNEGAGEVAQDTSAQQQHATLRGAKWVPTKHNHHD